MTADGATTGLDGLRRKVILYDSLPRIDFINDAIKGQQIANVEMGYFAFPLKVDNFMLRHEMPTGDMRPGVNPDIDDPANEQYYTVEHGVLYRQSLDRRLQSAQTGASPSPRSARRWCLTAGPISARAKGLGT